MEPKMEMMIGVRKSKSALDVAGQDKLNIIARWELPAAELMELVEVLRNAADEYARAKVDEIILKEEEKECLASDEDQQKS